MTDEYKRLTAYRVKINDLIKAKFEKKEDEADYLVFKKIKVSRVRIISTIVNKKVSDDGNYAFIILDDGTETIRVKCWKEDVTKLEKPIIGDIVEIVGRIREWNDERYLSCEIIRIINDPTHWLYHKYEFLISGEKLERIEEKEETGMSTGVEKKELPQINKEDLILNIIKENDIGKGTSLALIKKESNLLQTDVENSLKILLNDGLIYEPQKNSYKLVDA